MITHPQSIHFPIVFFLLAVVFEIVSFFYKNESMSVQSLIFLILSLIGSYIALNTGETAAASAKKIPGINSALGMHKDAGELLIYILLAIAILKLLLILWKKDELPWRIIILLLLLAGLFQVYRTAHLGGELVYEWGAGVKPVMETIEKKQKADSLDSRFRLKNNLPDEMKN